MEHIDHKVELHLSCAGFDGSAVQALVPDFITERHTIIGLSWYPCAEGPERYYITISICAALAFVTKVFLEELSKDLYKWLKGKLLPYMKDRPRSFGSVEVAFQNVRVWCYINEDDDFLLCVDYLPQLMTTIDVNQSTEWDLEIKNGRIELTPRKLSSIE